MKTARKPDLVNIKTETIWVNCIHNLGSCHYAHMIEGSKNELTGFPEESFRTDQRRSAVLFRRAIILCKPQIAYAQSFFFYGTERIKGLPLMG